MFTFKFLFVIFFSVVLLAFSFANNFSPCDSSILLCDAQSTDCFVSSNGSMSCHCKRDYTRFNSSLCLEVPHTCNTNSQCNHPFGVCFSYLNSQRQCLCMWGFFGNNCERGWLFIFTVVTAVGGGILLCLVAYIIFLKRNHFKANDPSTPNFQPPIPELSYSLANFPRAHLHESKTKEDENGKNSQQANDQEGQLNGKYTYTNRGFTRQESEISKNAASKSYPDFRPSNYF